MSYRPSRRDMHEVRRVSNRGERVLHLYPNDCYFAHLSIYRFAAGYCKGKRVLDAGCGAGYGSSYLIDSDAGSVMAIDVSAKAVSFCKRHFRKPNLEFRRMDLSRIERLPERYYDVVFSSNALEHVREIASFFRAAGPLLKPDGIMILALPPITNEQLREDNLSNPHHLHIWSLLQWRHFLGKFFKDVESYRHVFSRSNVRLDFANRPDECVITEEDFDFPPAALDEMQEEGTLTAIFVAKNPRAIEEVPSPDEPVEFIDDSFSRPPPGSLLARISSGIGRLFGKGSAGA